MSSHDQALSLWTSKNCIIVTTDTDKTIPTDDLTSCLQEIVGSTTQVTVIETPKDTTKVVFFSSEEAAQKVLSKPDHQINSQIGYAYNFHVKCCPKIQAKKYMKIAMTSAKHSTSNTKVAQAVRDKCGLQLGGGILKVSPAAGIADSPDDSCGREMSRRQDDTRRHQTPWTSGGSPNKAKATQKEWDGRTVEIHRLESKTTADAIVLLFENELPEDANNNMTVQRHPSKHVTYVTFETAEVAQMILAVPEFILNSTALTVQPARGAKPSSLVPVEVGMMDISVAIDTAHGKGVNLRGDARSGGATAASASESSQTRCVALKLFQLRMLHAQRFKTEQENQFPGMTVTIDTRGLQVIFRGKESNINKVEEAVHEVVDELECSSLEMSPALIILMRGITMMRHMVSEMKKDHVIAVYEAVGDTTLKVFAREKGQLEKAIKRIQDEVRDLTCKWSAERLPTQDWDKLKESLQVNDPGLLAITESDGCITLSGMRDVVAKANAQISQLAARMDETTEDETVMASIQRGECTVQVVRGDLTTFRADAIVNAANEHLEHNGELARAIVDAGGPDIQRECQDYVSSLGSIKPGKVFVSNSGNLSCKKVIHAVGPQWLCGNEMTILSSAVHESLLAADQHDLSSIAFPALGTGVMQFPVDQCTEIIAEAVKLYLDSHQSTVVKKVSLVHQTNQVLDEFCRSLDIVSGVVSRGSVNITSERPQTFIQQTSATVQMQTYPRQSVRVQQGTSVDDNSILIGSLKIEIVQGDLKNEYTAAIINVIDERFNPTVSMPSSGICITVRTNLLCSNIINVARPYSDNGWTRMIQDVLTEANQKHFKSISFPVLWPPATILDAIMRFTHTDPAHLKLVRIVTSDQTKLESFKEQFMEEFTAHTNTSPPHPPSTAAARPSVSASAAIKPSSTYSTTFQAPQNPLGARGDAASHGSIPSSTCIGQLTIEILHGDLTKQTTDAIVNGTDSAFSFIGATASAIVKVGGEDIVNACKKIGRMPDTGVAWTKAGYLPCSMIIHINAQMNLKDVIKRALLEAEQQRISSVAFPALGTGFQQKNPKEAAYIMLSAIKEFVSSHPNPKNLSLLKIVIYDKKIMTSFKECFLGQDTMTSETFERVFSSSHRTRSGGVELPAHWSAVSGSSTIHSEVKVDSASDEYKTVQQHFIQNARRSANVFIHEITRIQNPELYQRYMLCRKDFTMRHRPVNEYQYWHSTNQDDVTTINANGFTATSAMFTKSSTGDKRFARSTSSSGEKYVYQVRLLIGDRAYGTLSHSSFRDKNRGFDSEFDISADLFEDTCRVYFYDQVYPEYLIKYT